MMKTRGTNLPVTCMTRFTMRDFYELQRRSISSKNLKSVHLMTQWPPFLMKLKNETHCTEPQALDDIKYCVQYNVKPLRKILELKESVVCSAFQGIGNLKALKGGIRGTWRRQIHEEHRILSAQLPVIHFVLFHPALTTDQRRLSPVTVTASYPFSSFFTAPPLLPVHHGMNASHHCTWHRRSQVPA